jgi:LysR family hca operon transcriptional activator
MELRHLRYFIAVAETGSLTTAARDRLHTAQPSLSRQIRDLEQEVGATLLVRGARGIELTPSGRAFLDHARLALAQVAAGREAARRAARPDKPVFALGFLTGQELEWLPRAMRLLRDELPRIEVAVTSTYSPALADGLSRRALDAAFLRPEPGHPDLVYRLVRREKLFAVMPATHRLAARGTVAPADLMGETFIAVSDTAPVLHTLTEAYLRAAGVDLTPTHRVDYLSMAISLIASTGGTALLPAYTLSLLPASVTARPLAPGAPTVDLVLGHHRANDSLLLRHFLAGAATLADPADNPPTA